jgi:hypothetical protein
MSPPSDVPGLPGARTIGISVALPAGGAPTMGASYFVMPKGQIRADLGIATRSEPESALDYSLEVAWRQFILGPRSRVNPFIQAGIFLNKLEAGDDDPATFAFTASGGMEVFLLERFSIAAATGIAYVSHSNPDQGGFATGTSALYGNMYW